jgi:ABC-type Fe3+/spermidine/putrescine transport system ATPase subunit
VTKNGVTVEESVSLAIRPENIEVFKNDAQPQVAEAMNLFAGRIDVVVFLGAAVRLLISIDGEEIISDINEKEFQLRSLKQGDEVQLYFPPEAFLVFPEGESK